MPSTPPWTNVVEGLLMEYEKEVAEKVWRGRRSGAVSPGYGGGVYSTRTRSGRRGHNWKESQKRKFANVKKLFIGRKVVTCLLFVS
ncbi:unnamed protein product [Triticum turgidum subsp. durum]|uniref:Uncharacterized protein n=1 Tax=Triticum turgidum subsp. durum TaxID=4567 RepID=A0A9R0WF25_TRITD|nr:unnamed protein product [Triticum turgidum subsp. durum]